MALTKFQSKKRQYVLLAQDYLRWIDQFVRTQNWFKPYGVTVILHLDQGTTHYVGHWTLSQAVAHLRNLQTTEAEIFITGLGFLRIQRIGASKRWSLPADVRARIGHANVLLS